MVNFPAPVCFPSVYGKLFINTGKDGSEVVLIEIEGGGHTWPVQKPNATWLGKSTADITANDLMWVFFRSIPRREPLHRRNQPTSEAMKISVLSVTPFSSPEISAYTRREE